MGHDIAPRSRHPADDGAERGRVARPPATAAFDLDLDLSCPACGRSLPGTDAYEAFRVCAGCRRHFPLPARDRLRLLVDPDTFQETNAALVSVDPLVFRDLLPVPERLDDARGRSDVAGPGGVLGEAIVTGVGAIGGREAVLVVLDHAYLGGGVGPVAAEKIVLAMEMALSRRLPLVALCAAGGARTEPGLLSLAQLPKLAAAAARLHLAGVPFVAALAHPTTGGVYVGLVNQADVILAEPGAQVGFGGGRAGGVDAGAEANPSETLLGRGSIDAVVDRSGLRPTLATLLGLFADRGAYRPASPAVRPLLAAAPAPAWQAADLARHPDRPTAPAYLARLIDDFVELHGDRVAADDPAVVAGLGRLDGVPVVVVALGWRPGNGLPDGGRVGPAGYRKAARLMRLAGHLELPIVTLIDTPGAATGAAAEAAGIGIAMGQAFGLFGLLPVPIVSVVVGEGGGAGALALGIGDRMLMLQHAVYDVAGPDLRARPAPTIETFEAGGAALLTAHDCVRVGIVDAVVPEPDPAAHADPDAAARLLGAALSQALADLSGVGPRRLLDERSRKLRGLGQATPEGREAARREVRELQHLQRTLSRSLGDLRERWEGRQRPRLHLPRPAGPVHRPDLAELAAKFAARRDAVRKGAPPQPPAPNRER